MQIKSDKSMICLQVEWSQHWHDDKARDKNKQTIRQVAALWNNLFFKKKKQKFS